MNEAGTHVKLHTEPRSGNASGCRLLQAGDRSRRTIHSRAAGMTSWVTSSFLNFIQVPPFM